MKRLKVIGLLLGLLFLGLLIRKIGMQEIVHGVQVLGWRLIIPILIILPCDLIFTTSWQLFLNRYEHHSVPFWTLFRIKVSGEAANALTPLSFAGGDPVRVWLLSRNFPLEISGASVVVDRTLQILALVTVIFSGTMVALIKLHLPLYVRYLLGVTAILLLVFVLLFLFHQTRGIFQKLSKLFRKLGIRKFSETTLKRFVELDRHIHEFYRRDRSLFFLCFFLHLSTRAFGILELYVLAHFLGVSMGVWESVFFAAVIPVTNILGAIVPGNLGILEGVMSSLFLALHWNPADGLILQLARRIRGLFWVSMGIFFLFLFKSNDSRNLARKLEG